MKAQTIIHECNLIYDLLRNPPNIQLHQKRVAGVAAFILDHWRGPRVNRELVIAAALVHDVGNMTKATLDESQFTRDMLGEEYARITHWQRVKQEIITKYGANEHEATDNMLKEIDAPQELRDLIKSMEFKRNPVIAHEGSWEQKILAHADHLVSPYSVTSIHERLEEGRKRYAEKPGHTLNDEALTAAYTIAQQVQAHLTVAPEAITEEAVQQYVQQF